MKEVKVKKIKNGTVIDHITGGQALNVLQIIGVTKEYPKLVLTVAMNVPSKKMGIKDIVKVEGRELKADEVDKISLISPESSINIIKDYGVQKKKKVSLPETLEGVLACENPNCITNFEKTKTRFAVEEKSPLKLRCSYCERTMSEREIVNQF
ncbi:MAG: aspartate carbamoyltransferase regulatory subunit [Candidatus Hydrothermarchaeaceae archaeon]